MIGAPTLAIRGVSKSFGRNQALRDVNLTFTSGEFVGLMGPNGAGKSTLIKILDGVYTASGGEILLNGERVESLAGRREVGFIHQDLGLVDELSVSDNLRLGEGPIRLAGPLVNRAAERRSAASALRVVDLDVHPSTMVGDLSAGEKTLVAIARAFARGASILFVDEATSTLPVADSQRVIESLKLSVARGAIVIMVTHKLSEILDATNRVVVLLDGEVAEDKPVIGLDRKALVSLLVQHETTGDENRSARQAGEVLLEMVEACTRRLGPVDLALRSGQVVGISGLPGSGLHDVGFLASGAMRPTHGEVRLHGPAFKRALVPPHRESQGGFGDLNVRENIAVSSLKRWRNRVGLLSKNSETLTCARIAAQLNVQPAGTERRFSELSGGNKQKVIFGRALAQEPRLYVLCEPTRGVDIGTRSEIYRLIRNLRDGGSAVLVVSSDAEDLLSICDVIGIVKRGRVTPLKPVEEMSAAEMEMMV